jgi:hypothetical protein
MSGFAVPDEVISQAGARISSLGSRNHCIPIADGDASNLEVPHYFPTIPFAEIDESSTRFYAIDGSTSDVQFYNGICLGLYTAGYVCYKHGERILVGGDDDKFEPGKMYRPSRVLVTNDRDLELMYDEFLELGPVRRLRTFCTEHGIREDKIFAYQRGPLEESLSRLLPFCQDVLEWSLVLEILEKSDIQEDDVILRDGTLRSLMLEQAVVVELCKYAHAKRVRVMAVTKQSLLKSVLSYDIRQIDLYLQSQLHPAYVFDDGLPMTSRKLGCWFAVSEAVLIDAYKEGSMFAKQSTQGGRGCGVFFVARLDYVEKLQNYDWLVLDLNLLDVFPEPGQPRSRPDLAYVGGLMKDLTRLTQEHYILGYPYPLVEAHRWITIDADVKREVVARLKAELYKNEHMDNVDIENLFLDTHDRF